MDYLMLVDKFNPIDMGFYDRVELTEVNGKFMESQAGNRLRLLLKKAEADGIKLKIISAYRSFEYQQMLWEREVSHEMWGGLSYEKAGKSGQNSRSPRVKRTQHRACCGSRQRG